MFVEVIVVYVIVSLCEMDADLGLGHFGGGNVRKLRWTLVMAGSPKSVW